MKEMIKSKGMILFCLFILVVAWIYSDQVVRENKKDLDRWHETSQVEILEK